jgi:hypothetical protein
MLNHYITNHKKSKKTGSILFDSLEPHAHGEAQVDDF